MPTTILRPYVLGYKNNLSAKRGDGPGIRRFQILVLITFLTMACIFAGFTMILTSLGDDPLFQAIIPTKLIELVFYAFFILLFLSNTVAVIGNIYNSKRIDLLLSLPISTPRLYFAKLIETYIETGFMFFVFSLPAALAYTYALDLGFSFLLTGLLISIPLLLIPVGLSIAIGTTFVKLSSLVWRRGQVFFIGVIVIGILIIDKLQQLVSTVHLERSGKYAIVELVGLFNNPSPLWFPARWASDLLSSFLGTDIVRPDIYAVLLVGTAIGSVAIGYIFFDFFMLGVRSSAQSHHKTGSFFEKDPSDVVRVFLELIYKILPINPQHAASILKDLTSLVRDRAQSLQLLLFLGITAIYIIIFNFMTVAINIAPIGTQAWWAFLGTINVIFSGIILTTVMTRLVYPSMSLEGKAFWILTVAPIEIPDLIRAKFWCWFPITSLLVCTLLLSGTLAIGYQEGPFIVSLLIALSLSIGFTGLAIGLGSVYASFEWESPNQLSTGLGSLVLLLTGLAMIAITIFPAGAAIFLVTIQDLREAIGLKVSFLITCASLFLVFLINIFAAHISCKRGTEALQRLRG